jgi:hypothetical protein
MLELPPADALFAIVNPLPLPMWLLLVVAPRWRHTLPLVRLVIVPLLAIAYIVLIAARFGSSEGDFNSLAGVQALFADPHTLLAGWIHYLAFDLFVGSWIVEDALAREVPAWARILPLPLTLMFGPAGLLLYLVLRQLTATNRERAAVTGGSLHTGAHTLAAAAP